MVERQPVKLKVVGSSPTTHPIPKNVFLKIKKKKNNNLNTSKIYINWGLLPVRDVKVCKYTNNLLNVFEFVNKNVYISMNTVVFLCLNTNNPKGVIINNKVINTFSVGSVIKYLRVSNGRFMRRSIRGLKVFLNLLIEITSNIYLRGSKKNLLSIIGCNYNIIKTKQLLYNFCTEKNNYNYILYNLKLTFTKRKEKKLKSIKKRIKKKLIKSFIDPITK